MLIETGAVVLEEDLGSLAFTPDLRRASRNMLFAVCALERIFRAEPYSTFDGQRTALILGTNSGEIDTSSEFVLTHARSGLARPLLFQNSLHNSTAGFLSLRFAIQGPVFTLSSGAETPGECTGLAEMLLADHLADRVIVALVESHKLMAGLALEARPAEGCAVLSFGREVAARCSQGYERNLWLAQVMRPYSESPEFSPLFDITSSEFFSVARDWRPC